LLASLSGRDNGNSPFFYQLFVFFLAYSAEAAAKAGRPSQNLPAVDLSKAGLPAALFGGLARHPFGGLKGSVSSVFRYSLTPDPCYLII
jgi:hypothetical protein